MRQQVSTKGQGGRRFKFVGDTIAELKKVVWPTRREATYLTTIVIVVTVVVSIFLSIVDLSFSKLMSVILVR